MNTLLVNNFLIFTIISLTLFSCSSKTDKLKNSEITTQSQKMNSKNFFDYDEIVYYFYNYDESKLQELYDNQSKSEIDSIKMGVILGRIPKDSSNLSFIDKLEKIGYTKSAIDKSKFADIDKIFVEKSVSENVASACIYIYRDILIFKKRNNIIGTAKICFGCMDNQITGTTANTDNFGQDGDYERLENILRK